MHIYNKTKDEDIGSLYSSTQSLLPVLQCQTQGQTPVSTYSRDHCMLNINAFPITVVAQALRDDCCYIRSGATRDDCVAWCARIQRGWTRRWSALLLLMPTLYSHNA
jgi:hypothetical protein